MAKEEERHMENNTKDEQRRQTISISIGGGGGIRGLVVLGGALAIARLVGTFFTINKIKEDRHVNRNLTTPTNDSSQGSMENDCFTKDDDDEGTAQRQGSKTMAAQIEPHQMNETSSICKRQEENLLTHNDLEKPSIASAALLPAAHGNEHLFLSKANVGNCVKTNINMDNNCSKEHVLEKVGDGSMAELPEKSSPKLEETNDGLEKLEREDKTVQTDKHDRYTNLTKTRRFLNKEGKKGAPLMKYNHARLC